MAHQHPTHLVIRNAVEYLDDMVLVLRPVPGSRPIRPVLVVRRPDGSWRLSADMRLRLRAEMQVVRPVHYTVNL